MANQAMSSAAVAAHAKRKAVPASQQPRERERRKGAKAKATARQPVHEPRRSTSRATSTTVQEGEEGEEEEGEERRERRLAAEETKEWQLEVKRL